MRALNLDPGHATSLFNLADLYRWEIVKTGGKTGDRGKNNGWETVKTGDCGNSQNRGREKQETVGKTEGGKDGNEFGKKKRCENDKQQIALDSGEVEGGAVA